MGRAENSLTKRIMDKLHSYPNTKFIKKHQNQYGETGVSDLIGSFAGRACAFEVKTLANPCDGTPKQKFFIREWILAGGIAGVVRSWQDVYDLLRKGGEL